MFQLLEFQLSELLTNLKRNGLLTLAAVITVMASMVVFGLGGLVNLNLQHLLAEEAGKAQISAFLAKDLTDAQVNKIRAQIEALPDVKPPAVHVSSQAAFERIARDLGSKLVYALKNEGPSRLPAKFTVTPRTPQAIDAVAAQLKTIKGVDDVSYGEKVVGVLNQLVPRVRRVGLVALILMGLATCANIGTAIRLTIYARRREIRIMQLVGATDGFVSLPFLLEGLFHGLVGSLLAVVVTFALYGHLRGTAGQLMPWLKLVEPKAVLVPFSAAILALGTAIGVGSSSVSMRHFLRQV